MIENNTSKKTVVLTIGTRLKKARLSKGYLSRRNFAQTHNLLTSTYRSHEAGESEANFKTLLLYSKILTVSIQWLLTGEGEHANTNTPLDQINTTDIDDDNIGCRLEAARKICGYKTRRSFAKACHSNPATIRVHEFGINEIKPFHLLKYCSVLDLSLTWLITGIGNPLPKDPNNDNRLAFFKKYIELINAERRANKMRETFDDEVQATTGL